MRVLEIERVFIRVTLSKEREREREMASLARQSCRYVNVKLSP